MYHSQKYPFKLVLGESKLILQSTWISVVSIRCPGRCLYLLLLHFSIHKYHSVLHPPHTIYPVDTPQLYRLHGCCWRWMKSRKFCCMAAAGDEWNLGICTRRIKWQWQKRSFDKQRWMWSHVYHFHSLIYPFKQLSFLQHCQEKVSAFQLLHNTKTSHLFHIWYAKEL